jgi:hypothetical protein
MRPLFIKQTKDYDVVAYLEEGLQRFLLTEFCMTMTDDSSLHRE